MPTWWDSPPAAPAPVHATLHTRPLLQHANLGADLQQEWPAHYYTPILPSTTLTLHPATAAALTIIGTSIDHHHPHITDFYIYPDGSSLNDQIGYAIAIVARTTDHNYHYINTIGSSAKPTSHKLTNNVAEIMATTMALCWVLQHKEQRHANVTFHIIPDSTLAIGLATGRYTPRHNKTIATQLRHIAIATQ